MKNVKIEEKIYKELKKFCKEKGFKIYSWVSLAISDRLSQEKKNANLQNNKSD